MGLGVDISFEKFLIDLNVNEENYFFANLRSIVQKSTLFLKRKVNDMWTNVFNIHVRPIWGANRDVLYYPYFCCNLLHFLFNKSKQICYTRNVIHVQKNVNMKNMKEPNK